ncbi:interferon-induced transmembrane protein 1-like isoform X1 [Ranitomeya imitator]|uniref:interferon-induced transmembrane protein 1-like isoform X1 n=2 Tax=Ranitomeya imitator TaxID=111125 RepID=UPI0037E88F12
MRYVPPKSPGEDSLSCISKIMENRNFERELNNPPRYDAQTYQPLKEEMEFGSYPPQTVQSTVVTIMPESPPVRDHIIWSLFNTMYLNFCCLGFLAFVFSIKSRDRKLHGDRNSATSYGSTARSLNIAATVLSILFTIVVIIIFIIQVQYAVQVVQQVMEREREKNEFHFGN